MNIKMLSKVVLLVLLPSFLQAQLNMETQNIINDIYKFAQNEDKTLNIYTFWFPVDFWELSTKGHPGVAQEDLTRMKEALKNYLVIAVSEMDNSLGFMNYTLRDELKDKVSVVNSEGQQLEWIEIYDLPHDAYLAVNSFDETVENMFGLLGKGLEFMVFDISECNTLFNPQASSGFFKINVGDYEMEFNLPLGAFLPKKKCPVSAELYNGNWNYCPIHGNELITH